MTDTYAYDHQGNRVMQTSTSSREVIYPNSYYTIDGTDTERHITLGSFGSIATSTVDSVTSTASTIYHHHDHLGGTHVDTDESGAAVEYIIYNPFGSILLDTQTGDYENHKKFTSKELDEDTGWYYYGARYYMGDYGRFMSQDSIFLNLGTNKKVLNSILVTPQKLNSYSYTENNPLTLVDPTGGSSLIAWIINPVATATQVAFWRAGAAYLSSSRPASAALMNHALNLNPRGISINASNQGQYGNIVDQIKGSQEYNDRLNQVLRDAESSGQNSIQNADLFSDGFTFSPNTDLGSALHRTSVTGFSATRSDNGTWNTEMTVHDTYNFELDSSLGDSLGKNAFNALGNVAVASQNAGAISGYDIDIKVEDKK